MKNILYAFTCLSFAAIIGAAIYEHLGVVPQWAAAPPASLAMYQGEYPLKAENFWMPIHPVTMALLIVSLIVFWRTLRRINLLVTLAGYVIILIITFIYFVPELISITGTPYSDVADPELTSRAKTWEILSIIRLFVLIGLAINLFMGLTKPYDATVVVVK